MNKLSVIFFTCLMSPLFSFAVNIDLTDKLSPVRNQGETYFCTAYAASDLLNFHLRQQGSALDQKDRVSSLQIAGLVKADIAGELRRTVDRLLPALAAAQPSAIEREMLEEALYPAVYQEYIQTWKPLYSTGISFESIFNSIKRAGKVCLEEDYFLNDNETSIYIEQIQKVSLPYQNYHAMWKDLATGKFLKDNQCKKSIVAPQFQYEIEKHSNLGPELRNTNEQHAIDQKKLDSIHKILKSGRIMAIGMEWAGISKNGGVGDHTMIVAGLKSNGDDILLGVRNHSGEECLFKETKENFCRNGVEWINVNTLLPQIDEITTIY